MDSEKEVLLTQEGYDNLEKELEFLTTEDVYKRQEYRRNNVCTLVF